MTATYESVPVPGNYEPLSDEKSKQVIARAKDDFCLLVCEDHGWRDWIWFPGQDENEFCHWWVSSATTKLPGEFYPAIGPLSVLAESLLRGEENLTLHIDGTTNTYVELPKQYRMTLIPRFSWNSADLHTCGGQVPDEEVLLKWWKSIELTALTLPNEYLWQLKMICAQIHAGIGEYRIPVEVKALIERDSNGIVGRRWEGLIAHLPIPNFEVGTFFYEVNGVPFLGRGSYQSVLGGRFVGDSYMRDEGGRISEEKFLFLVSFYPNHNLKGLPRYTSRDGILPDQLPPTYSYWLYEGRITVLSREGFIRQWPSAGLLDADIVRTHGEKISEAEFRRHFASYAKLDPGAP